MKELYEVSNYEQVTMEELTVSDLWSVWLLEILILAHHMQLCQDRRELYSKFVCYGWQKIEKLECFFHRCPVLVEQVASIFGRPFIPGRTTPKANPLAFVLTFCQYPPCCISTIVLYT